MSEEFNMLGEEYNKMSQDLSDGARYDYNKRDEQDKPSCYKCNSTNVFMIQCANEEGNSCMACIGCIFNMIIEVGVKKFCEDNKDFEGMLFSYKDKFKT